MENARAFGSFRASLHPRDASKMMIVYMAVCAWNDLISQSVS